MAAGTFLAAAMGLQAVGTLGGRLDVAAEHNVASLAGLGQIQEEVTQSRLMMGKHLLARDAAEAGGYAEELRARMAAADSKLDAFRKLVDSPEEQAIFDPVLVAWGEWKDEADKVLALPEDQRRTTGTDLFNGHMATVGKSVSTGLASDFSHNVAEAAAAAGVSREDVAAARTRLFALLGGVVALLGAIVTLLRARLSRPLGELTAAMDDMAAGDLDRVVPGTALSDEIGRMARALGAIKDSVSARTRAEAEARAATQAQVVESLAGALGRLKAGRLDCAIDAVFPADYEALRRDFNETVQTLATVIVNVTAAADSVTTGSTEIASAAADLSNRTNGQAGTIEETAASVRQLSASVGETAQLAEQVSQNAREAEAVASESGAVMAEAVGAMDEIARSSTQMEAIVSLIDGIAFQTNLLALNAGVEAARAGEAGKGFAVVASEVRSLAQRAGEAARDISAIIKSSSGSVTRGVGLITRTRESLQQIHARTAAVAEMIGAIATTAREQADGLRQIDAAVAEMDGMTQRNAALVEQSTAASRTLAGEASRLDQLMSGFSTGAPPRRPPLATMAPPAPAAPRPATPLRRTQGNAALAEDWSAF
jgi:methyl-accepting chemotaxis protein